MSRRKVIMCPSGDDTCPYCNEDGNCTMLIEEGVHPKDECDEFM